MVGAKAKLNVIFKRVCEKAKRFYEIATFFQYAVADGIHRLLFAARSRPRPTPTTDNSSSPSPNRRRDGAWGNSCSLSAWHWPFYAYN